MSLNLLIWDCSQIPPVIGLMVNRLLGSCGGRNLVLLIQCNKGWRRLAIYCTIKQCPLYTHINTIFAEVSGLNKTTGSRKHALFVEYRFNRLRSNEACKSVYNLYIYDYIATVLHIMACRLLGANPFSESALYLQTSDKCWTQYKYFISREGISRYRHMAALFPVVNVLRHGNIDKDVYTALVIYRGITALGSDT